METDTLGIFNYGAFEIGGLPGGQNQTPHWMAAVRKNRTFADGLANQIDPKRTQAELGHWESWKEMPKISVANW
jgi:hypothetical protein